MKKEVLANICLGLIILLFSYTAVSKLLTQEQFIFQMRLAPVPWLKSLAPFLAWIVPLMELLIVFGLLVPRWQSIALLATFTLLLVFELYIAAMLLSGLKLPCTCGGVIAHMSWKVHLLFNALFMGMSAFSWSVLRTGSSRSSFLSKSFIRA